MIQILGLLILIGFTILNVTYTARIILSKQVASTRQVTFFKSDDVALRGTSAIIYGVSNFWASTAFITPIIVGLISGYDIDYSWSPFIPLVIWCSAFPISLIGTSVALGMHYRSQHDLNRNEEQS